MHKAMAGAEKNATSSTTADTNTETLGTVNNEFKNSVTVTCTTCSVKELFKLIKPEYVVCKIKRKEEMLSTRHRSSVVHAPRLKSN